MKVMVRLIFSFILTYYKLDLDANMTVNVVI